MPIKHAALKQLRKDRARILRNKAVRSELKTLKKRMLGMLSQQKREEALRLLPELMRRFDQASAKRIIHKNTASRVKARLMRRLAPVRPASSASA